RAVRVGLCAATFRAFGTCIPIVVVIVVVEIVRQRIAVCVRTSNIVSAAAGALELCMDPIAVVVGVKIIAGAVAIRVTAGSACGSVHTGGHPVAIIIPFLLSGRAIAIGVGAGRTIGALGSIGDAVTVVIFARIGPVKERVEIVGNAITVGIRAGG